MFNETALNFLANIEWLESPKVAGIKHRNHSKHKHTHTQTHTHTHKHKERESEYVVQGMDKLKLTGLNLGRLHSYDHF